MAEKVKIWKRFEEYSLMQIGCILFAFSWTTIVQSAGLIGGGASGLALLIQYATGFPMGVSFLIINGVLVGLATIIIGRSFGFKTIYCIASISLWLNLFENILPFDMLGLGEDKLLSTLLAGGLSGIGVSMCFMQGGSTGGTDIVAMIINKYRRVSYGRIVIISDIVIIGSSYIVYHNNPAFPSPLSMIIYGYVLVAVFGYTVDAVMAGSRQSSQIFVFSKHYSEIARDVTHYLHRGVTILDGTGAYTGEPSKMLVIMCRKPETNSILKVVRKYDPDAFVSVGSVMGVYGKGFEAFKIKMSRRELQKEKQEKRTQHDEQI